MRKSNIAPIFKRGKKEDPQNYRPDSLTSVPGKVVETLILGTISTNMMDKKVIWSHQHGFTKSCLTNLTTFYKEITRLVDKARAVDVYGDFTWAFNTVL